MVRDFHSPFVHGEKVFHILCLKNEKLYASDISFYLCNVLLSLLFIYNSAYLHIHPVFLYLLLSFEQSSESKELRNFNVSIYMEATIKF